MSNIKNIINNFIFEIKSQKFLLFCCISWIFLWLSINTFPTAYLDRINIFENLKIFTNFLRISIPLLGTNLILLIYCITHKTKNNIILILFSFYFFSLAVPILIYDYNGTFVERVFLLLLSFNAILILKIFLTKCKNADLKVLLYISFFFLCSVLIIYMPIYYEYFLKKKVMWLYFNNLWENTYFDNSMIRVTGAARIFLILAIFFLCVLNLMKKRIKKLCIIGVILFCAVNIWLLQSRTIIFIYIVVLVLNQIFLSKSSHAKKIIFLILMLILPILTVEIIQKSKKIIIDKVHSYNGSAIPGVNESESRIILKENFSSGRTLVWNEILKFYNPKNFFGYGSQADRYEINLIKEYGSSASNAYLYGFLCGGYLGLLFLLLINIILIYYIYVYIKNKLYQKNNIELNTSVLILISLLMRGILENCYAVFSIDFLLFIICFIILQKNIKRFISYKFLH